MVLSATSTMFLLLSPVTRIEERQEKKIGKIYYPAAGLSTDTIPYYTSAYDMDMRKVIDVYAAATVRHVDRKDFHSPSHA